MGDLATRFRDPTSESLQSIQSEHTEYDRRAIRLPRAKPRRVSVLRAFTWPPPIPLLAPVITTTLSLIPCMKFCFTLRALESIPVHVIASRSGLRQRMAFGPV